MGPKTRTRPRRRPASALLSAGLLVFAACTPGDAYNPANPTSEEFVLTNLLRCNLRPVDCEPAPEGSTATTPSSPGGTTGTPAPALTEVYLFSPGGYGTSDTPSGDLLNNRSASSALCQAARSSFTFPNNTCQTVRAVISYSGDSIATMTTNHSLPASVPVLGPTGTTIAANWATFVAGPTASNLDTAQVINIFFRSFSDNSGNFGSNACAAGPTDTGHAGTWNQTTNFLGANPNRMCSPGNAGYICACW